MPVGTVGTVKGLTPRDLHTAGSGCVLGNTYHLALRPGANRIATLGGLAEFTGWRGPMLTDSGGYQVVSLSDLTVLDELGVTIRTHITGRKRRFTPESVIALQEAIGADIIMPLDVCLAAPATVTQVREAADRTLRWAQRAKRAQRRTDQWLFAIVQGGMWPDERRRAADALTELDFPGYAIGGLSVGEDPELTTALTGLIAPELPRSKPRYLMGVGTPAQLIAYPGLGIDMFDCVLPTRLGRSGIIFTGWGRVNLLRANLDDPHGPLDQACPCEICRRYSRAALRALFQTRTALACRLASVHNVGYLQHLMATVRRAIGEGWYARLHRAALQAIADPRTTPCVLS